MSQGSNSDQFSALRWDFQSLFPPDKWSGFASLGVDSNVMLSLAAGARALGKFAFFQMPPYSAGQQTQDMGLSGNFEQRHSEPLAGLSNHLPIDMLRQLSTHILQWDPPETRLNAGFLRDAAATLQSRAHSLESLFMGGSDEQVSIVLDLGNAGMLADNLARLTEQGVTASPTFREAFSNMPVLDHMVSWDKFRAASIAQATGRECHPQQEAPRQAVPQAPGTPEYQ